MQRMGEFMNSARGDLVSAAGCRLSSKKSFFLYSGDSVGYNKESAQGEI